MKFCFELSRGTAARLFAVTLLCTGVAGVLTFADGIADASEALQESYREVPIPPDFHVEATVLDGAVFADASGRTLYKWPLHRLRNGYSGEAPDTPGCYDRLLTVTAGLMSPYPPGIKLPEIDSRLTCTDLWPPVLASEDAEPVGKWTIIDREDSSQQWAFDEQPLYTSVRDSQPGDVLGGTSRRYGGDSPALRVPVGPPSQIPPGFAVKTTAIGRLLTTDKNNSIYSFSQDTSTSTACDNACLALWQPLIAPALARQQGEWSIFEPSPGLRQWVFRGQPLYTYTLDQGPWSQQGSDVAGWHNVFTQVAPAIPASFSLQPTLVGNVLADSRGMSIYIYSCGEDSADQLSCDHPDDTQVYRLAMCGGGDAVRCLQHWPYVEAAADAVSANRLWRILWIDPNTGHFAAADQADAKRVWSYRGRPVYTFGGDQRPGDVNGSGTGEWRGQRNGLRAFWIRDDYMGGIL